MRTFPTAEDIKQFIERASSSQFTAQDLDAFYKKPQLWRPASPLPTPEEAQAFWQGVWDELALEIGGRIIVPPVPRLTDKQRKSIAKFRLLLVYIPALNEDRYPPNFVKPDWGTLIREEETEHLPLRSMWIAVETFRRSEINDETVGLPMVEAQPERYGLSFNYVQELRLKEIAHATGMPLKGTHLPSVEQMCFIANIFNWLHEQRRLELPDLGMGCSWEMCHNRYGSGGRLIAGGSTTVEGILRVHRCDSEIYGMLQVTFRILFEL